MKEIFAEVAAAGWRDWLKTLGEFIGMLIIVSAIALLAIGLAP